MGTQEEDAVLALDDPSVAAAAPPGHTVRHEFCDSFCRIRNGFDRPKGNDRIPNAFASPNSGFL